jgi:hypothetical protein
LILSPARRWSAWLHDSASRPENKRQSKRRKRKGAGLVHVISSSRAVREQRQMRKERVYASFLRMRPRAVQPVLCVLIPVFSRQKSRTYSGQFPFGWSIHGVQMHQRKKIKIPHFGEMMFLDKGII